jgi:hypothetical protein
MVDFRKKLLGLGLLVSAFTGVSYGQILCPAPNGVGQYQIQPGLAANLLRVEGETEEVSDLNIFCNTGGTFGSGNLTVTVSNGAITSKGGASATGGASDAMLVIVTTAAVDTLVPAVAPTSTPAYYFGTVSPGIPGTVTFPNVTFPTGTPYYMSIRNIRVNASGISTSPGANQVDEQVLVTNAGVGIFAPQSQLVGLVYQGFKTATVSGTTNFLMCQSYTGAVAGVITIAENFGGAFKTLWPQGLTAASTGTCGGFACTATNGENGTGNAVYLATLVGGGFGPPAAPPAGTGLATHGTRFQVAFSGIPTGVTLSVPLSVTDGTLSMNLTAAATGAYSPLASGTLTTSAAGTATAVYEVTSTDNTVQTETTGTATNEGALFVDVTAAANYSTSAQAAFTAIVTVAPQVPLTATSDVPDFTTPTPSPLAFSPWNLCQTTLLFPFVSTNGVETGIALSNTSLDPGKIGGGGAGSTATPNQGACTLNFYGALASAAGTAVSYLGVQAPNAVTGGTTPYIQPAGTSNSFPIAQDGLVPAGFSGYMIAQCNYLYGHGFAYIAYQLGTGSGATMGFVANVLNQRPIGGAVTISSETLEQ